jgi:hypothetical protein
VGEPVAWQWRSRIKGGAWDAWENGRNDSEPAPFMDVENRALYTAPPAQAADLCGYDFTAEEISEVVDAALARGTRLIPPEIIEQMRSALLTLIGIEAAGAQEQQA